MFRQFSTVTVILTLMSGAAVAKTVPKTDQQVETVQPKPKDKPAEKSKEKPKPKDVDAFFKEAEKQMEDGPSCQPPPEPIA